MKKYLLLLVFVASLFAQVDTVWVRFYNGPSNGVDAGRAIAVDGQGNVCVAGISYGSFMDYATVKYNSVGVQQWAQRFNGPGGAWDWIKAIVVNAQGDVYVTGGVSSAGYDDYGTIKYNSAGTQVWVQQYNGPGNMGDGASAIALDDSGYVYVTGGSTGSSVNLDYATVKYNSAGVQQWVARYNGTGSGDDWAYSIAVDAQYNVYVTGESRGTGGNDDYVTIKYNSAGIAQWTQRYNGTGNDDDWASEIAVDASGNVYVTGYSGGSGSYADYTTIKYNSNGDTLWVRRYNGLGNGDDEPNSLAVDALGNVFVTGESYGSGTGYDYATVKYNSAGVQEWVQRYNGSGNSDDWAYALAIDASSNVYVTGYAFGLGSSTDCTTIKYSSAGVQRWAAIYNGPASDADEGDDVAVDDSGYVYVTGYAATTSTNTDFVTIKYVQTQGIEEITSPSLAKTSGVELFPNPAKTFFNIKCQSPVSNVKIFDVTGKIIKSEELKGKYNRVSLDGIKNGVYIVKVGDEMVKEKLVVTK
jgi:uncharacterized delta-60 repeat protein